MPTRILVKTTSGPVADDWHVGRFSLLTEHLRSLKDSAGGVLYDIVARDRNGNQNGDDTGLLQLANGAYDQLWLIGADVTPPARSSTRRICRCSDGASAHRARRCSGTKSDYRRGV